ncbi:hypothetical protein VT06_01285 [Arsukibacterium sp. MJ3]|uniref:hypothetical protein n=1 Tax=Arsukibacterium sp. MJ3 TaxID=1632859 RepID=UPI000627058F|nr:hypothetical protein [Arsukibacterium sp. MJ3]KKO50632.1 hypothetical protein VT06_01285 [Arsukibacterium sp. MJ3]
MTQTFTDLAERCDILWQQRLSLCNSDYITLSQLQQHDQHLLQSVQLCQRYLVPVEHDIPLWLSALLDNSAGELTTLLALPLALPAQCLLAELWLALKHTTAAHYTKQYCRPEHSPLLCLLATKPMAADVFQKMLALDIRSAIQLTGLCGLTEQRVSLRALSTDTCLSTSVRAELHFNLYLLGQPADKFELLQQLLTADSLTPRQLQLLLLAANADDKIRIINALSLVDTTLAINAMGFSGLSKFCPLLLELNKQPEYQVATQSALITMLGALVTAALQRDQQTTIAATLLSEERLIAGVAPARHNLAALWRSGNPRQRFASAALRVLQQPGLPLAEPTSWRGGVWPVA